MKTFKLDENITKYTFGKPFDTETVVLKGSEIAREDIEFFKISKEEKFNLIYNMDDSQIVFGLGENQRGINKRGGIYESFCTDDANHTPNKKSLYGAHNFIVLDGEEKFGVFVDFPGKVVFDVGFSNSNELRISLDEENFDIYIINGDSARSIVRKFLKLIGESYVPPKWAFGYQQSRWSYKDESTVLNIADSFIKNDIPCDAIYLDIDYMDKFKDFTIDKDNFPNFKNFIKKMKNKGFRLVPIIDAGVKIEKGYNVYEEGIEKGYFCTDSEGKNFTAAVWPGLCHFPDFLNKEARRWFGLKYKILADIGIEGFWNDMNEPTLFYTKRGLKEALNEAKKCEGKNLDVYSFFNLKSKFLNISNADEDYKSIYHNVDGNVVNHYKVHNMYGYNMLKSASEGLREVYNNKRFLLFSRASYIGMHKYGGIWTGDNHSWWDHILLNIKMMPSLNMCGFLYIGADTGGFNEDANSQLVIRWTEFSIFTPLFRNHSSMGTRNQEPFSFDDKTTDILRNVIKFRYALIPYIYSEYMKSVINNDMYFMPICFEYDDKMSRRIENQLLVGGSIMIAPVYEENSTGRYVYCPEDMLLWKVSDFKSRKFNVVKKGHMYLDVKLDEIPIFIKKDSMLIIGNAANNVDSLDNRELDVIAFVENKAEYIYYDDDGISFDYQKGNYSKVTIKIEKIRNDYNIDVENSKNSLLNKLNFEIIDQEGNLSRKTIYI
jgi:alpha-glucosidase